MDTVIFIVKGIRVFIVLNHKARLAKKESAEIPGLRDQTETFQQDPQAKC